MTRGKGAAAGTYRGDLVTCVGGPLDGFWYWAADWAALVTAGQRMAPSRPAHLGVPSAVRYTPTGRRADHPHNPAWQGEVYAWPDIRQPTTTTGGTP